MLALVRDHWAIENRLHWRRDVTLGEDACQTRTGSPPSLLAQINSAVLRLMDRMGVRTVPRQMRFFDAEYDQALDLVLTGQCSVYENWKALFFRCTVLTKYSGKQQNRNEQNLQCRNTHLST